MEPKNKYTMCAKRILANLDNRRIHTHDIDEETLAEIIQEIAEEIQKSE